MIVQIKFSFKSPKILTDYIVSLEFLKNYYYRIAGSLTGAWNLLFENKLFFRKDVSLPKMVFVTFYYKIVVSISSILFTCLSFSSVKNRTGNIGEKAQTK